MQPRTLVILFAASALACSSGSSGGGGATSAAAAASQFCATATSCGQTVSMCQGLFSALLLSESCQQDLENVTCAQLAAPSPPAWWSSCFPPCTGSGSTCNGDSTITICSDDATLLVDCSGVCAAESLTYTGTCATSYGSQTSTTPKCWCQ